MRRAENDRPICFSAVIPKNGQSFSAKIKLGLHQQDQNAVRKGVKPQVPDSPTVFFKSLQAFFPTVVLVIWLWKAKHVKERSNTVYDNQLQSILFLCPLFQSPIIHLACLGKRQFLQHKIFYWDCTFRKYFLAFSF